MIGNSNKSKNKAFTLVEMLVTVLIFSLIIGVGTGVFVSAIKLQKYNLTHQQFLSQTSYVMEYMARAIRMAQKNDGTICVGWANKNYNETANSVEFATYSLNDQCWRFFLEDEKLKMTEGVNEYDLTSGDFRVKTFNVNVTGDTPGDVFQPRVTIFMEIEGKAPGSQPRLKMQTTISQRNLDL